MSDARFPSAASERRPQAKISAGVPPRLRVLARAAFAAIGFLSLTARGQEPARQADPRAPVDLHAQKTLYVVPYAHLDTQWRWTYPQVIREYLANTLHQNFALIDKYPHYVFNFSGSRRYEMMREYYPQDWERLKGYIRAGRWFPCGSSVDEGDANVPGLEAMVRHVLYGNHYFRREFGVASAEFMLPDCFGFPASLPTVLAHCGLQGFSTQKLTWGSAVGIPFKVGCWVGPDGSLLPAALDPGSYGGGVNEDLSQNQGWLKRIEKNGEQSGIFADYHYYGTGDRGGAPGERSVDWMEKSVAGTGPVRVVSSPAQQMFLDLPADAREKLPRYQGDLLLTEHSAGSLTSEAYMKRWNRKNELLADAAERAAVAAAWLGGTPYPAKKLYDAWDLVLGSQMHDMLPGTSLPKGYEFCWNDEALAANQFAAVETEGVGAVAAALDTQTRRRGSALVVYNPLATAREDVVTASLPGPDTLDTLQVLGPDGQEVPSQVLGHADGAVRFLFLARVPAVSFSAFEVVTGTGARASVPETAPRVAGRTLENARYRVTVNEAGDVASIFDKTGNRELLAAPMRLEFHQENPMRFPAWNMDWSDRQKPARGYVEGPATIRVVEAGPVRATLEIERRAEGSRFVSRVSLAAGDAGNAVEFHDQIDWGTREASLKLALPLTVSNPLAAYDDKVGVVRRGNNEPKKYEVPQHEWFDLTDADDGYGVSVLNDCKFGSDKPDDHTMRLTLLYTPGVRGEYQDQACQDFGRHDIAYAVAGHPGGWQAGGTVPRGHRFNQPLRAFATAEHAGALGRAFALASLDNPQVEIVAIKKAEDSDETIVRLRETGGQAAQTARLRFGAPILAAREVDGQERDRKPAGAAAVPGPDGLSVKMTPFSLRAFALKLGGPTQAMPQAFMRPLLLPPYDEDVVSTRANRADGGFDHDGRTFPAESLPPVVVSEGIPFQMGPTEDGQKNALACRGQTISLPAGGYDRLVLLAAADGDKQVSLRVSPGGASLPFTVPDWSGYLGQWDNRLWQGDVPELAYAWHNALDGLVPGFVKTGTVAWYSSHRHERGGDGIYQYCYLFKHEFELPPGARSLTLPAEPGVRLFAATLVKGGPAATLPLEPLFDTFADHRPDAPAGFQPAPGKYRDTITVVDLPPLYRQEGGARYTLDGSEPTAGSPAWLGPLVLHASATVKTRMYLPGAPAGGPVTTGRYEVDDQTPPTLRSASANTLLAEVRAVFSEPVEKASAEAPGNYRLQPAGVAVQAAKLSADGTEVRLTLDRPLPAAAGYRLLAGNVRDLSPRGNVAPQTGAAITLVQPAFTLPETVVCDGTRSRSIPVPGLPVGAHDPWTLNFFVRADQQPENRTLIAGFGGTEDVPGHGRYLSKFANGIHYWTASRDGETATPLDLGRWQMLTAAYDGTTVRLYKDAVLIGSATLALEPDESVVNIAPLEPWDHQRRFRGKVGKVTIWKEALPPAALATLLNDAPAGSD